MQNATLWRAILGVEKTVVEHIEFDEDQLLIVAHVRARARAGRGRCGRCSRRSAGFDPGQRRRWRALDLGTIRVMLEAEAPRVGCRVHGPTVAAVSWARHGAGHTLGFDAQVAWLATQCSKAAITELMRIGWRTVGAIITRVWADTEVAHDQFAGLRRIGIDEISYKKGHKYLSVVVDHDTGRLIWAAPGRDRATLGAFFEALEASGAGRCAQITHVSADSASWITGEVRARCPDAVLTADPFHVVKWAGDALDAVRREAWSNARRGGATKPAGHSNGGRPRQASTGRARNMSRARYALLKNPENLTTHQQAKLAWVAATDPRLYRAYLLKEGLRLIFRLPLAEATHALDRWISWARRCRIKVFVDLQRRIVRHRDTILAAIEHGLSNGRIESINTKIRLITRIAFGFRSTDALIALAMLNLGGHRPALPSRK